MQLEHLVFSCHKTKFGTKLMFWFIPEKQPPGCDQVESFACLWHHKIRVCGQVMFIGTQLTCAIDVVNFVVEELTPSACQTQFALASVHRSSVMTCVIFSGRVPLSSGSCLPAKQDLIFHLQAWNLQTDSIINGTHFMKQNSRKL